MAKHLEKTLIDKEITINPSAVFNFKISPDNIIDYANHSFCEISGYEEYELIGESLKKITHPDMPSLFTDMLSERLEKKEPMQLISKFLAKNGRYFWLLINFETKVDDKKKILAHYSQSKAAPQYAIHKMDALHKILSKIEEKTGGTEASKRYLMGFLEERDMDYDQYVKDLSIKHPEYEKPFQQPNFLQKSIHQDESLDNEFNTIHQDKSLDNQFNTIHQDKSRDNQFNTTLQDKNQDNELNTIHHSSNTENEDSPKTPKAKTKKKKSLLKKVFGK